MILISYSTDPVHGHKEQTWEDKKQGTPWITCHSQVCAYQQEFGKIMNGRSYHKDNDTLTT